MWHRWFNRKFIDQGMPVINEMRLTNWLPEGWSGIADWLVWDTDKRAFTLADLKTIKGEGLKWLRGKPKEEHVWQLSAYYHALKEAKFPLVREFMVIYLPMNDVPSEEISPKIMNCTPLPKDVVWPIMEEKWARAKEYLATVDKEQYVTDKLAEPTGRIQRLFRSGTKYDLKLIPHWTSMFCPYDNSLCDCNTGGTNKIGEYRDGEYYPRKGYEDIEPEIKP